MNYYYKPVPLPGSRVQQWTKQKIPASGGIDKTSKIYSMSNAMEFKKKKKGSEARIGSTSWRQLAILNMVVRKAFLR